ncbi:pyridoxal phosphate-dependent decarboxylase family protein [Catenuloplanes indicus]|uniref:L-2,4-diaminobutyrate decarboxylase n=1 Tax=Catenuloplanes indicus TaxID=137267 RepID=A0AAE4AVG7_9ACTN|nr:pyridoxal-dependent decarboxylase [Catenuloplanes indicus]MDQ0363919.1 L-2,4-diaminobutyrate decarboxylase [Catenuloplanes indicus]
MSIVEQSMTSVAPLEPPAGSAAGLDRVRTLTEAALEVLGQVSAGRPGPVTAGGPAAVTNAARASLSGPLLPEHPAGALETFVTMVRDYATWSVDLSHPAALARMQCPPTPVAAASELVVGILNQSLHAWESGPYALELERYVVRELADLVGYGPEAGGTITAGGSISNLMAILTARDSVLAARMDRRAFADGLGALPRRPVVLATDATHFSIGRAAGICGIGEDGIVRVPSDELGRLLPAELDRTLTGLPADVLPVAVIACVGATDQGWVDDLPGLSEVCRRHGVWLHADAAYGGGALFSPRLRERLAGIAEADSVTLDLHKFGWTAATSGVFLLRDAAGLAPLSQQTTTLNAGDDAEAGFIGLYGNSVQATRRAEAFKIAVTMRALGRDGMAAMVDGCYELARYTADQVEARPGLELAARPAMTTVLFRFRDEDENDGDGHDLDALNGALRRRLMEQGTVLLARTRVRRPDGTQPVFLKIMILNPATTTAQIDHILDQIVHTATGLTR